MTAGLGAPPTMSATDEADQLRLIIEATPTAMVMVGSGSRLVLVNAQAETLFGYDRSDLLRMTVPDLVPDRLRDAAMELRESYLIDPEGWLASPGPALFARRRDGSEVPIEIGLNPIRLDDEDHVLVSVIDIEERLAAQAALKMAGEDTLRRSILASMPCSVIVTGLDGTVVTVNPASEELLGYSERELLGLPLDRLHGVRDLDGGPWIHSADGDERERTYRRKDGDHVLVGESITPVVNEVGDATGYLAVAFDITKRIEARAKVDYLANHDVLTGLPNRTRLLQHLSESLRQADEERGQVGVVILDIDHFKQVNDTLGHQDGDELLLRLADRLKAAVRPDDVVARLGGDEFVVVFKNLRRATDLDERIAALTSVFPTSVALDDQEFHVTASVGGAVYPQDGESPTHLLKHADIAMYRAKAAGRNNVQWFVPSMLTETNERVTLALALARALEADDELTVVYQAQVDMPTGKIVGVEALARWNSPLLGHVPPDRFIPVAEEGGMIDELGRRVLRQACTDFAAMRAELGGAPMRLAVNVSPRQFTSRTLLRDIETILRDTGLAPSDLELEITEGILMDDVLDVLDVLHTLKSLGVTIVVDDFGQGYSSLAYLTRFPVDKLKIDRVFVWRLSTTSADAAVVDAILAMAHALAMTVVAEGVETPAQLEYLRERGCEEGQGYLFGKPIPAAEFVELARRTGTLAASSPAGAAD